MNRPINICLIAILILLFTSCHKEAPTAERTDYVRLNIQEQILSSVIDGTAYSKAPIKGASFPKESSYGLFICKHTDETPNPYQEHATRYNNIKGAKNKSDKWLYNYSGYSSFPTIFIVKNEDKEGNPILADIFAYAPHKDNVTSPENVPFVISDQNDFMYALENRDPSVNKNIDPLSQTTEIDVPLTFAHAFAMVEFCFTIKNETFNHPDGNGTAVNYTLSNITVQKNPDKDPETINLYKSGSMNAIDGTLHSLTETESISLSFSSTSPAVQSQTESGVRKIRASILLAPAQPDDDEYIFTFSFNSVALTSSFSLKKSHLQHGLSETYGFLPGYRYTFNFEIDNYIHLSDVEFGTWTTEDEPVYKVEI